MISAGTRGAVTLPAGKAEALQMLEAEPDMIAINATTQWLPPVIAQWLISSEWGPKDMEGRPLMLIPVPTLSEAEKTQLTQASWMLGQAMKPSTGKPELLVEAIQVAMSELRFRSKSEEQHTLNLKVWANACQKYPLWAVQKAADWWSKGARSGDELGHFLTDVRLAIGHNVLKRQALMQRLLSQS
ncbi:hypothetical protein A6R70_02015 [Agrobacterium rubi]|nr:hypothetical protein [Agrobacterium rubi]